MYIDDFSFFPARKKHMRTYDKKKIVLRVNYFVDCDVFKVFN